VNQLEQEILDDLAELSCRLGQKRKDTKQLVLELRTKVQALKLMRRVEAQTAKRRPLPTQALVNALLLALLLVAQLFGVDLESLGRFLP
jgi:hypothetical protein